MEKMWQTTRIYQSQPTLILRLSPKWQPSLKLRLREAAFSCFFFFFFFFFHAFLEECGYCLMNSIWTVAVNVDFFWWTVHPSLFMDPQISFFINFFIKNESHGTIYIFNNYFVTVISTINFQFQQNKPYPNRPLKKIPWPTRWHESWFISFKMGRNGRKYN